MTASPAPHEEPPSPAATSGDWPPGPVRPLLTEGALHVWHADLDRVGDWEDALLSRAETARADRFLGDRERRRWRRARGILRALLGLYLDIDPSAVRLRTGTAGKPSLDPPVLSFNLSHSGGLALYAFTAKAAVGVDVELSGRPVDVLKIAARAFGPGETERLRALGAPQRRQEFLRAWVRHEAELKRLGTGFGALPRQPPSRASTSWVEDLDVGAQGAAAVAVDVAPGTLCCWQWPQLHAPADAG